MAGNENFFRLFLLLPLGLNILLNIPLSNTARVYPLMCETKFHTHKTA
jgi:hypothetical protein